MAGNIATLVTLALLIVAGLALLAILWTRHNARTGGAADDMPVQARYLAQGLAIGIALGMGCGAALGLVIGNLRLGIAVGPALGASLGIAIGSGLQQHHDATDGPASAPLTPTQRMIALSVIAIGLAIMAAVVIMHSTQR